MVGTRQTRSRLPRTSPPQRAANTSCLYRIDGNDCITSIGGQWTEFARANRGKRLAPSRVKGTNLWDHITGLENRLVYAQILEIVRKRGVPVQFSFRCDAPDCRREFLMKIAPGAGQSCVFQTTLLRMSKRPFMGLLDPAFPRTEDTLMVCNWCMRAQLSDMVWRDIESAIIWLGLVHAKAMPEPAFTICPTCMQRIRNAL